MEALLWRHNLEATLPLCHLCIPGLSRSKAHKRKSAHACQLYEQRGKIDGHELEDWLQVEAEISPQPKAAA